MGQRPRGWIAPAATLVAAALLAGFAGAVHARQPQESSSRQSAPEPGATQQQAPDSAPSQSQGQAPAPPPVAVTAKVVNVVLSVLDKKKNMIAENLTKDDFILDEDGRTQSVSYFARASEVPLTVGLLIDTSPSRVSLLPQERASSQNFLYLTLRPQQDKAFLIHFDREVELLQDLTNSRDKLQKALNEMDAPQVAQRNGSQSPQGGPPGGPQGQGGGGGYPGGPGGYPGGAGGGGRRGEGRGGFQRGGTTLYDAVYLASNDVIKKQTGRKALILLTDGVDRGSKESLASAIETAQRADAVIYAIYFAEDEQPRPFGFGGGPYGNGRRGERRFPQEERADGKKALEQMARETGGKLFEVSKKASLGQILTALSDELQNQYSLGYTPEPDQGPGYHKIHVTTKQKDLAVQARDGYFE